jgi:hypothetical protein
VDCLPSFEDGDFMSGTMPHIRESRVMRQLSSEALSTHTLPESVGEGRRSRETLKTSLQTFNALAF